MRRREIIGKSICAKVEEGRQRAEVGSKEFRNELLSEQ